MSLSATRACINAILDGSVNKSEFEKLPIFNLAIPKTINGVDSTILNPRNTWKDKEAYDQQLKHLANLFIENFKRYEDSGNFNYSKAGPNLS